MENAEHLYELCKNCYIKECKPPKKMQKHIVLSLYKEPCAKCGKNEKLVIDIDVGENE
jgi:hypothetical protein